MSFTLSHFKIPNTEICGKKQFKCNNCVIRDFNILSNNTNLIKLVHGKKKLRHFKSSNIPRADRHIQVLADFGQRNDVDVGCGPFLVTVTTRIITFLVGNSYKPSFATVTRRGPCLFFSKMEGYIVIRANLPSLKLTARPGK